MNDLYRVLAILGPNRRDDSGDASDWASEIDDAISLVYDEIDKLCWASAWDTIGEILDSVDVSIIPIVNSMAFLSISYVVRQEVPAVRRLYDRLRTHLSVIDPTRVDELLQGWFSE